MKNGYIKICSGIVECAKTEPYISAVKQAGLAVGRDFAPEAEAIRIDLIEAIKLNLVNRKDNAAETLIRRYNLPLTARQFGEERDKYCLALIVLLGMG